MKGLAATWRDWGIEKMDTPSCATQATPEVATLDFATLFGDVRPLKPDLRRPRAVQSARAYPRETPNTSALPLPAADETQFYSGLFRASESAPDFARPGVTRGVLRQFRAGKFALAGEVDLHGLDRYSAQAHLSLYIQQARLCAPTLRVIHGIGRGSTAEGAVLKPLVRYYLSQHPDVLAYCDNGNAGSLLVLLRSTGRFPL